MQQITWFPGIMLELDPQDEDTYTMDFTALVGTDSVTSVVEEVDNINLLPGHSFTPQGVITFKVNAQGIDVLSPSKITWQVIIGDRGKRSRTVGFKILNQ